MKYIPLTEDDKKEILVELGKSSIAELYKNIPRELILSKPLNIPNAMSEDELHEYFNSLASKNMSTKDTLSFVGAGSYDHSIPSLCSINLSRANKIKINIICRSYDYILHFSIYSPCILDRALYTV